jgi:hypothetical protein
LESAKGSNPGHENILDRLLIDPHLNPINS